MPSSPSNPDALDARHHSADLAEHLTALKLGTLAVNERERITQQILAAEVVNRSSLGRLACAGLPSASGIRAQAWQLLLNYIPAQRCEWDKVLAKRRAEYSSFCADFSLTPTQADGEDAGDPLDPAPGSKWQQFFQDKEVAEQIQRDVERTHSSEPFFGSDNAQAKGHREELQRLLFVFSKLNPGLDYVQGMNELAAPLYMVFKGNAASDSDAANAEADTFFCFVSLMTLSEMRDLYTKSLDASNTGVKAVLRDFMQHLHAADPSVAAHLQQQKVDAQFFAFRWMTVLFAQDVDDMATIWRLWDFILGDASGCKDAIMRLCCALILRRRSQILAAQYPDIVKVVQSCGRDGFDVEETIAIATSLSQQYLTA